MSIEQRTVPVTVQQSVNVMVCDTCADDAPEHSDRAAKWTRIRVPYTFGDVHFCSFRCLAQWAERQAEKSEAST